VKIRYKDPDGETSRLLSQPVPDNENRFELASDDMQFAASVAEMGLLLRDSEFKANASFDHVLRVARKAQGRDAAGYRGDFIRLAEKTSHLKGPEVAQITRND